MKAKNSGSRKLREETLREAYARFVRPLKTASAASIGCDKTALRWFEQLVPDVRTKAARKITTYDVAAWRTAWVEETGLTPQTWNKHARHVRAMFRVLEGEDLLVRGPQFKWLHEDDPIVRIADDSELRRLLEATGATTWPQVQNAPLYWRSLIVVGVSTGLRRRDLLSVRKSSVNFSARTLSYLARKTKKRRTIPISGECCAILSEQFQASPLSDLVWYSTKSNRQWYREWERLLSEAKICGKLDFHNLRSTCGSRIYQVAGLAAASEMLAHSSLAVTRKHYISTQVASDGLRPVVDSLQVNPTIPEKQLQKS